MVVLHFLHFETEEVSLQTTGFESQIPSVVLKKQYMTHFASLMPIRKQPCKDLSLGALCVHSEKAFHFSCRKYVFPWALLLSLLSCN